MGGQALTPADPDGPTPEPTRWCPGPHRQLRAAAADGGGADPAAPADGAATAGMTADGRPAGSAQVPGAGMTADAGGTGTPRELTADLVAGPGGVMTDEVGVVTGELTLKTGTPTARSPSPCSTRTPTSGTR